MTQVSNLNVQVNQNQVNQNLITVSEAPGLRAPLSGVRSGTLVEGQVLSKGENGEYSVRVQILNGQFIPVGQSRVLLARATVDLIVGEHFRAVWDSGGPGKTPVLRLSQGELSFLSKLPLADRELAAALLSRGMPLSSEVMLAVRESWRRMGGLPEQLGPLLELWARDLPMTPGNVQILSWYMALNGEAANAIWGRMRKALKERSRKGENPVEVLRDLKEGGEDSDPEIARFLRGHSLLLRAPRGDADPALLGAPLWPVSNGEEGASAHVFVGRVHQQGGRDYWQMGFGLDGPRLGFIGGGVESDGRSYNLNLCAERPASCELLKRKRLAIRKELEGVPLALQFVGISQLEGGERKHLTSARGLDITV
ncbi:MAG: hypothetical protein LBC93_03935 [Synergistaceae bacterium]|jgi:hypothetical protein|nr:hypothetical protein [Synergistaceae bacterium]